MPAGLLILVLSPRIQVERLSLPERLQNSRIDHVILYRIAYISFLNNHSFSNRFSSKGAVHHLQLATRSASQHAVWRKSASMSNLSSFGGRARLHQQSVFVHAIHSKRVTQASRTTRSGSPYSPPAAHLHLRGFIHHSAISQMCRSNVRGAPALSSGTAR